MATLREGVAEVGRRFPLYMLTGTIGTLFLVSSSCDSFLLSGFVDHKRILRQFDPLPSPYTNDQGRTSAYFSIVTSIKNNDNDNNGSDEKSLLEFLSPISSCSVNQMSGTDLAYIGDVVFELFVRSRHVWPSKRTTDLQNTVVGIVRAEHQSYLLQKLKESFPLSEKENQVLMRGRNAVTRSKNRRNPAAYQDSTALEALIGYIYINDKERCQELLAWFETVVDVLEKDSGKS